MSKRISKHFKESEFFCKCDLSRCKKKVDYMDADLLETIVRIREQLDFPLVINSAYRCTTHNASVGGVSNSLHKQGKALDIALKDGAQRHEFVELALKYGLTVIVYPTFLHIDNREGEPMLLSGIY